MGFEPMMRVLQTLALPLGDVAVKFWLAVMARNEPFHASRLFKSGRWDSNPRPSPWQGDVLPLYYARILADQWIGSAERQNRTDDTAIFSRVLYQLSYLGDRVVTS